MEHTGCGTYGMKVPLMHESSFSLKTFRILIAITYKEEKITSLKGGVVYVCVLCDNVMHDSCQTNNRILSHHSLLIIRGVEGGALSLSPPSP